MAACVQNAAAGALDVPAAALTFTKIVAQIPPSARHALPKLDAGTSARRVGSWLCGTGFYVNRRGSNALNFVIIC